MKAARLHQGATSLVVEEIDPPVLHPGCVIVDIESCFISPFAADRITGGGHYMLPPRPFTPGMDAVGRIAAVADDVQGLAVGTRVYCDPLYQSAGVAGDDDFSFIGSFAMGPQGERLLAQWPDGGFAEQMLLPAECAVPIPAEIALKPEVLCRLGWLGTAYGGYLHGRLEAGQHVAVNGAAGVLGASAVLVALAMGAARVYALGRRPDVLKAIAALDTRIVAGEALPKDARVDVVFSSVNAEDATTIENLLPNLKRFGQVVITGATGTPLPVRLGWLLLNDISIHGSLWFPRWAGPRLVDMIASGQLDLSRVTATTFPLADIGRALSEARAHYLGLNHVAIVT